MSRYLELFKGLFDDSIIEKTKLENKPYVAYSVTENRVVYTEIPTPTEGPVNNEIWYTSSDESVVTPNAVDVFGANIVSNTYENGKGVITFDGDVTSIGAKAFLRCKSLTSVTIPDGATSIGSYAFDSCSNLTSVIIGNNVTSIGEMVFYECKSLASVTIGNNVTSIGSRVFYDCSSLTDITIPNSVTSIGYEAFYGTGVYNKSNEALYINNCLIDAKDYASGTYTIKEGTRLIASYAFYHRSVLTSITIPNSVTTIGDYAFDSCSELNTIIYEGTQAQWNKIYKGSGWKSGVPATYVQCTDGQVTL